MANPHLLPSAGALIARRLFLLGSLLNLRPQQLGHLLQAALTASALPHTSERLLSLILAAFYSLGDPMQVTGFLWLKHWRAQAQQEMV